MGIITWKNNERSGILLNGIFIALGLVVALGEIIVYHFLKWDRLFPNLKLPFILDPAVLVLALLLFGIGVIRELKGRNLI